MQTIYSFPTAQFGTISLAGTSTAITHVFIRNVPQDHFQVRKTALMEDAMGEILDYLEGKRYEFTIPMRIEGTAFQKLVWQALMNIPYGETRSYKEIAMAIGRDKAYRAVGLANNKNRLPILIPCHRVIGSNGGLVGFSSGVDIKEKLLLLERSSKQQID